MSKCLKLLKVNNSFVKRVVMCFFYMMTCLIIHDTYVLVI